MIQDITVLELSRDSLLPKDADSTPVVVMNTNALSDHPVHMCVFPREGKYVNGKLRGLTRKGWLYGYLKNSPVSTKKTAV